jgi:putative transposase
MSHYTRLVVPGGTYFFTLRLEDRTSRLLTERVDLLRAAVRLAQKQWPFRIEAAVVLPDHLHMIWTMPDTDGDFSKRWRLIKSTFSRHVEGPLEVSRSKARRGEKGIWQRRFWEHLIRDELDFEAHRVFALTAPVQAGLVSRPQDWAHSSVHRDLRWGRALPAMSGYGPIAPH